MKKSKSAFVANTTSGVLSFILFIILLMITLLFGAYVGFFKKSVLINNIYVSDYGEEVQRYLYDECESLTLPSGVPLEVLDDVFPLTIVNYDINHYAKASMNGEKYTIDTAEIEKRLRKNISEYTKKNNIKLTDEQNTFLDEYVSSITKKYVSVVQIPLLKYFSIFKQKFEKIFFIGMGILFLTSIFIIMLLFRLHSWRHRPVRYIIYSVLSAAIVSIGLPTVVLISGFYERVNLKPRHFYDLVTETVVSLMKTYIYLGVMWILIAAMLFMTVKKLKNCSIVIRKEKFA